MQGGFGNKKLLNLLVSASLYLNYSQWTKIIDRGDTPLAAPIEEGYSSSETLRPAQREILYSPALMRKIQTRNAAIQTRRARTRDKGTQTEAEALLLRDQPPPAARRTVRLVLFLIAANLVLAAAAITGSVKFPAHTAFAARAAVTAVVAW